MAEQRPGLFHYDPEGETSPRRLAILIGGGAVLVLATLWLLGGDGEPASDAPPMPVAAPSAPAPMPAPPRQAAAPVGPSVAELRLYGVMGTGDGGAAIISVGPGPQQLVRVGRSVAPGIELLAVAGDHVLLRERGREVQLAFADDAPGAAAAPSPQAAVSPGEADVRREAIALQAALMPWREGGQRGFEVRDGALPPLLADAGLQPGDVLLRVAGNRLEDSDLVAEIPARLAQQGRLPVEIIRDGEAQTLFLQSR